MLDVHQPGRRAKLCPVDFLPAAHAADKLKRKVTSVADYRDKKCHKRWRQRHAINCLYTAYTVYTVFIHCLYCVNCFTPLKKKHVCLYKSLRKVTSTLALQWEAHCTKPKSQVQPQRVTKKVTSTLALQGVHCAIAYAARGLKAYGTRVLMSHS